MNVQLVTLWGPEVCCDEHVHLTKFKLIITHSTQDAAVGRLECLMLVCLPAAAAGPGEKRSQSALQGVVEEEGHRGAVEQRDHGWLQTCCGQHGDLRAL